MSIGKSGIKNLAFVRENSDDSSEPVYKDSEDNVSVNKQAGLEPLHLERAEASNLLYKGKDITARGYLLIVALAATIFAGR